MLTLNIVKHIIGNTIINGDIAQFQHTHATFLCKYFAHYHYHQFRVESDRAARPLNSLAELLAYQNFFAQKNSDHFTYLLNHLRIDLGNTKVNHVTLFDFGCVQGLVLWLY